MQALLGLRLLHPHYSHRDNSFFLIFILFIYLVFVSIQPISSQQIIFICRCGDFLDGRDLDIQSDTGPLFS